MQLNLSRKQKKTHIFNQQKKPEYVEKRMNFRVKFRGKWNSIELNLAFAQ